MLKAPGKLVGQGLLLHRAHSNVVLVPDAHGAAREAARELLQSNPKMQGTQVVAALKARGLRISPASVSRLRSELKTA